MGSISIEQYRSRIGIHDSFVKTKAVLSRLIGRFWNITFMMLYLNVFYLPTLKQVLGKYKMRNEVKFWFTHDILQYLYSIDYKASKWCGGKSRSYNIWSDRLDKNSMCWLLSRKWSTLWCNFPYADIMITSNIKLFGNWVLASCKDGTFMESIQ